MHFSYQELMDLPADVHAELVAMLLEEQEAKQQR
jgi:hypothetical protein